MVSVGHWHFLATAISLQPHRWHSQAKDPGPWVSQLDIQKTEERWEWRRGTEESLPSGELEMKLTLAEVNGNSHGPEVMRCTPQGPNFSCLRVEKTVAPPTKGSEASADAQPGSGHHMQHMQGMQGMAGGMAGGGMAGGGMAGGGMAGGGMAGHMAGKAGQPDKPSASQVVRPMALALGEVCVPGGRQCASGTDCKAGVSGFTCQAKVFSAVTPGTLTLTQSLRMALIGALVLLLCLCVVGFLYRRRAESRSFDELPKVMGKTNLDLPRTRKYEAFDSDEEYRTF
eukprot:Skav231114  [mRNA]  locus=scaffold2605:72817:78128:+ [translate_table: standard]